MKTAYWPVACDLIFSDQELDFFVGEETAIACDGVVDQVKGNLESDDYVVIPSAGIPPEFKHANICMSGIMMKYLLEQGIPNINIQPLRGETFNTQGEALAVVKYLRENKSFKKLVIAVKWWHALRSYTWIMLYLKKFGIQDVEVQVVPLHSKVATRLILAEFWKAAPYNLVRMARVYLWK